MSRFTIETIRKFRKIFDIFDIDGDGVINESELRKIAHQLGYHLSNKQISHIMQSRDLNKSGNLNFEEFLKAMPGNMVDIPVEDHKEVEVRLKFLEFDKDCNGSISVSEAHEILEKDLAFTPSQTLALIKRYDRNNDGHLSYGEFVQFYRRVKSRKSQIQRFFRDFDLNKDGHVSVEEIKEVLSRCSLADDDVETLVLLHDKNKDGKLQYDEFVRFIVDGND